MARLDLAIRSVFHADSVMVSRKPTAIEGRLGYTFSNRALLDEALVHASTKQRNRPDNERLEFLGDRVLGLVVAEALTDADPDAGVGLVNKRFNLLVCGSACTEAAVALGIGKALKLGRSEQLSGGRNKKTVLAGAMEAVIAAVYLDGGLKAARSLILRTWKEMFAEVDAGTYDAKGKLQEWAQKRGHGIPVYTIKEREGPDHAPIFTVEVCMDSGIRGIAQASSKKSAEQIAAAELLSQLSDGNG